MQVSYFSLAREYCNWIAKSVEAGFYYSVMVGSAQTVVEFMLKQIINDHLANNTAVMSSHNIRDLYNYVVKQYELDLTSIQLEVSVLSNYNYSTRYPGRDAFVASEQEIKVAVQYAIKCYRVLKEYIGPNSILQESLI